MLGFHANACSAWMRLAAGMRQPVALGAEDKHEQPLPATPGWHRVTKPGESRAMRVSLSSSSCRSMEVAEIIGDNGC